MNLWKKLTGAAGVIAALSLTGMTVFAADVSQTPAEAISELTGKSVEEIMEERNQGTSYGAIANGAGVLDEFKKSVFDSKEAWYQQQVKDGNITKEAAEDAVAALTALAERHADCDGSATCVNGDGICLWSAGSEACISGHKNGACAWTDTAGSCLWGHDGGACSWVDGNGNCLSGHGGDNCGSGRHSGTGSCWNSTGTSTGTSAENSSSGSNTQSGHHGSSSRHYNNGSGQSRGHGNGGHHRR